MQVLRKRHGELGGVENLPLEAGEMVQWVECLLGQHEDQNSDPQPTCKMMVVTALASITLEL